MANEGPEIPALRRYGNSWSWTLATGIEENMKILSQAFGKPEIYRATHRRRSALSFSRSSNRFAED